MLRSSPIGRPLAEHARRGRTGRAPAADDLTAECSTHPPLGVVLGATALLSSLGSLAVLWNTWTASPTSTTGCACGDPALFIWFLAWPARAIASGHTIFFSTALFHPYGINLLANTSVLALGLLLAPVTWLFGPIATYNVALFLAPVLSALTAAWLARRFVTRPLPAVLGGLVFGFSPLILFELSVGHLMTATLAPLPVIVGLLDDLIFHPRGRPIWRGSALAAAIVVEFFLSTELLLLTAVMAGVAVLVWVICLSVKDSGELRTRVRRAAPGLAATLGISTVILAWPAWFAVAGPRHYASLIWAPLPAGLGGVGLHSFTNGSATSMGLISTLSGYAGRPLAPPSYLSLSLLAVCGFGLVLRFRELRVWAIAGLIVLAMAFSLGPVFVGWAPWQYLDSHGLLGNVIESRFIAFALLGLSVLLAMTVDKIASWVPFPSRQILSRFLGAGAATLVFVLAVSQYIGANLNALPLAVSEHHPPRWWQSDAGKLPSHAVVLSYPLAFATIQTAMAWQAQAGLGFSMVGGGGPQGLIHRSGRFARGMRVLADLTGAYKDRPAGTALQLSEVRSLLRGLGVTTVVVPVRNPGPVLIYGQDSRYAGAFLAAAIGSPPRLKDGSWLWSLGHTLAPVTRNASNIIQSCSNDLSLPRVLTPSCVLGSVGSRADVAALRGAR